MVMLKLGTWQICGLGDDFFVTDFFIFGAPLSALAPFGAFLFLCVVLHIYGHT